MALQTQTLDGLIVSLWVDGDGPPLLYLHGYEQHPGGASFLQRLAKGRRVYAPELPGYGASTGMESMEGVLDLVLYYRQLVASWGVEAVDVVGHSLGGMIGAEIAAICPQLVRRLVLVDAFGLWLDDRQLPDPFTLTPEELAKAKWHDPEAAPDPEPSTIRPDPDDPNVAVYQRAENLAAATKLMWPIPDRGLRKRLPLIEAPTLIVHGESDGLIPVAYADEFARLIPAASVVRIAGAGHLPMIEREDEFLERVEAFLAG